MNRPMKMWEVVSAFRDRQDILYSVFSRDEWRTRYLESYLNFDQLVDRQDRQILDAQVPIELTHEIAALYPVSFEFDPKSFTLWKHSSNSCVAEGHIQLTALQVHDHFGGAWIEEVFEYGSAHVTEQ